MPSPTPSPLLQGTLDLLVLRSLAGGPQHGYGVLRFLKAASDDALLVEEGALYPALHRLEHRGAIEGEWGTSENNRRAKRYRLSEAGRRQLTRETGAWRRYVALVDRILAAGDAPATAEG